MSPLLAAVTAMTTPGTYVPGCYLLTGKATMTATYLAPLSKERAYPVNADTR